MTIPTNIIDAAAQIKNGEIGVIDIIKIGDVTVSALTGLQTPMEKEVTRRRVQAGFSVIDGMIDVPTDFILTIILANPDFSVEAGLTAALTGEFAGFTETYQDKRKALEAHFHNRDIINVIVHDGVYVDRVITRINPIYDNEQNWECFIAQVTVTPFDSRQVTAADDVNTAMTAAKQSVGGL